MNGPRYQPLVVVALALSAGIALDHVGWLELGANGFATTWCVALGGLVAWFCVWRGGHPATSVWLLLATVAATGGAWHALRWELFPSDDVSRFAALEPTPACAKAIVLTAPEVLPAPRPTPLRAIPAGERTRTELRLTSIRDGTDWLAAGGRCQLVVYGDLVAAEPGDEVQIFGQLRRPAPPMNPGEFDFAARARADRRLAILAADSPDCVTVVVPNQRWSLGRIVETLREYGQQTLRTYVGPRQAGIAAAVLLGVREELPRDEIMPFFLTGTVHLLVVSGLNVAILATGLYALVWIGWLPRRVALALIIAVVALYTLVAGGEPPVLRAAVLVVLVCVGAWSGRRGVAFNSLAAAAVIVMAINPAQLFQTGTQLSFLCVAILIWVSQWPWGSWRLVQDPLDRLIAESRPWHAKAMRSVAAWTLFLLLTSAVVWFVTLPLVLYRFHVASPVALVIAPAVWLLALVAMWAGFITLACGWFMPLVAVVTGAICGWSLDLLVRVVDWAEAQPGGHFWAPGPALWWVIGFYLGLIAFMLWGKSLAAPRWQIAALCLWILVGLAPALARPWTRGDELRCTFLAMGHGTC
ncbi:MAG: ComEC/Rec2 family competence protein, partial [Pirellulales bacterium]